MSLTGYVYRVPVTSQGTTEGEVGVERVTGKSENISTLGWQG